LLTDALNSDGAESEEVDSVTESRCAVGKKSRKRKAADEQPKQERWPEGLTTLFLSVLLADERKFAKRLLGTSSKSKVYY
jgi:hypothetical protein